MWRHEVAKAAANTAGCGSRNGSSSEVGVETLPFFNTELACQISVSRPSVASGGQRVISK